MSTISRSNSNKCAKSESEQSIEQDGEPRSCTSLYTPSDYYGATILVRHNNDNTSYLKEKIVQDHEVKFIKREISPENKSVVETLNDYGMDRKLNIKEPIIQDDEIHRSGGEISLAERNDFGEECLIIQTYSTNDPDAGTFIKYEIDETLNIKEEIVQDDDIHQNGEHNIISVRNNSDVKFMIAEIPPTNDCSAKPSSGCETLYIKEEIIQDQVYRENAHNLTDFKKLQIHRTKIQRSTHKASRTGSVSKHISSCHLPTSKMRPSTRHYCDQCSRSYSRLSSLGAHKRSEHAAVKPQFTCDICGHKTNRKDSLSTHIASRHSQTSKTRHYCDKCSRSYCRLDHLNQHKREKHAAVKPQFTCDICGHKTNRKDSLSIHIASRHSQTSNTRHYCDKCCRSYGRLNHLNQHKREKHAAVKPQFICDFCGHKTKTKGNLSQHITFQHLLKSKMKHSTKYYCDECPRSYSRLHHLNFHKRSEHVAVQPQFTCDICGHKTKRKGDLSRHISSRHLLIPKMENPTKHHCDKCSRSYSHLSTLNAHKRLEHASVKSQFFCEICGHRTRRKYDLSRHVKLRHLLAPKIKHSTKHHCDKCSCSYSHLSTLNAHKRSEHAAVKPQFTCDFCGYRTKMKSSLLKHIYSRHLQILKTRHYCDECSCSYTRLYTLNSHKRLKHSPGKT